MAQVIQLQFDFAPIKEEKSNIWHDGRNIIGEFMGITLIEQSPKAGRKDPCKDCWAKGLCDDGECGRHLYPIDVDNYQQPNNYDYEED